MSIQKIEEQSEYYCEAQLDAALLTKFCPQIDFQLPKEYPKVFVLKSVLDFNFGIIKRLCYLYRIAEKYTECIGLVLGL